MRTMWRVAARGAQQRAAWRPAVAGSRGLASMHEPDHPDAQPVKVAFLGGGKMAGAFMGGLVENKKTFQVTGVVDINKNRRRLLTEQFGVTTFESVFDGAEILANCDMMVLAIKPQTADSVFRDLRKVMPEDSKCTAISILAGTSIKTIVNGTGLQRVCRSMPNTNVTVQEGMTVWTTTDEVGHARRRVIEKLFSLIGEEEFVSNEDLLDACTALSGSGPAYFLMVMEAMVDSGVHMGLSRELAHRLVIQTMFGTAQHVRDEPGKHLAVLRNDITSPGGTTASALYMAERGGFRTTLSDSVWAAYRRSRELGDKEAAIGPEVNR